MASPPARSPESPVREVLVTKIRLGPGRQLSDALYRPLLTRLSTAFTPLITGPAHAALLANLSAAFWTQNVNPDTGALPAAQRDVLSATPPKPCLAT